jgi:hypothetical protein
MASPYNPALSLNTELWNLGIGSSSDFLLGNPFASSGTDISSVASGSSSFVASSLLSPQTLGATLNNFFNTTAGKLVVIGLILLIGLGEKGK